jgi:transcription-repair coupling factor (superfamily II helicase)
MSSASAPSAAGPAPHDEAGTSATSGVLGAGTLAALPRLLRAEPALATLIGAADATVAVPEAAQAMAIAALAALGDRGPIVVVTATGLDAERLGDDLSCLLEKDEETGLAGALGGPVAVLPAWETLPFERVSPETETMGRRLAILHALTSEPDESWPRPPRVIVTPVRALLQRIGPLTGMAPLWVRPGQQVDVDALLRELVEKGYRREHQVEHRGEFAMRGGIVDVFPSTADAPVRIDLWGDEVDRLTEFAISDQRSSRDLAGALFYGCREFVLTDALRAEAERLVTLRPWGISAWDRLARGEQFDGMESWLPFVDASERVLPDLLGPTAQVVLVEPRRIRDRGAQLLDEEAALAETLAATWGARDSDEDPFPRLHVPFERLLRESPAGLVALPTVPEGPSTASVAVGRFEQVAGDPERLAAGVHRLVREGYTVTLCAATAAGAGRLSSALAETGVHAPVLDEATASPGPVVVAAPLVHGFILPEAKVAVLSETDVTGRRVPHRRARPRARAADGFFDDLEVGSFVVHRQHGVARFEGVTSRTMAGTTRDYLILQYRGSDRLYLPVEQIEAITPYSGGESPGPRRVPPPARWRPSWCSFTAGGSRWRAMPSAPTRRGRPRWRGPSGSSRPRTSSRRSPTSRPTWKSPDPWTASSAAMSVSARPRSPCGPSSRQCRTAPRPRCWPRRPSWPASTPRPSPTATPPIRSGSSS